VGISVAEMRANLAAGQPLKGAPPATVVRQDRRNDPVLPEAWSTPTDAELASVPEELREFYASDAAAPSESMLQSLARGTLEELTDLGDLSDWDDYRLRAARSRQEPVDPRRVIHHHRLARARHLAAVASQRSASRTCLCGGGGANYPTAGQVLCSKCAAAVRRAQDRAADLERLPDGRTRGELADELLGAVR